MSETTPAEGKFTDEDANLWKGIAGEKVIESKVNGGQQVLIVSGFILAFSLAEMLALDLTSWVNVGMGNAFVISLAASSGFGFVSVLLFAFLTAKVTRLAGQSACRYGDHGDAELELLKRMDVLFPGEETLAKRLEPHVVPTAANKDNTEMRFSARAWYYAGPKRSEGLCARTRLTRATGREHFITGMWAFVLQLVLFATCIVLCICDRCDQAVAAAASSLLIVLPCVAIARLLASGAFWPSNLA